VRLKFGISNHDMETKAKAASKFLKKSHKVRIELPLKGRQKAQSLTDFAKEKINSFLIMLEKESPFKIEREIKKEGRGLTILISKIEN